MPNNENRQGTPAVFTPATLAARWDCSESHVRKLIASGELPHFRLGGKLIRIRAVDVEKVETEADESPMLVPQPADDGIRPPRKKPRPRLDLPYSRLKPVRLGRSEK